MTFDQSNDSSTAAICAIRSCDPLFAIISSYKKTFWVLQATVGSMESFKSFGSRIDVFVYSYKCAATKDTLSVLLIVFISIGKAALKVNRRASILSAAAPKHDKPVCADMIELLRRIKMLRQYCAFLIDARKILASLHRSQYLTCNPARMGRHTNSPKNNPKYTAKQANCSKK